MGWNNWNTVGSAIHEGLIRKTAGYEKEALL
jgi:hypothetical protein